jgi:hypothetical protein
MLDEWLGFDFLLQQPSKELLRSAAAKIKNKKNKREVKMKIMELISCRPLCTFCAHKSAQDAVVHHHKNV